MAETTIDIAADLWRQARLLSETSSSYEEPRTSEETGHIAVLTDEMGRLLDDMVEGAIRTDDDIRALAWFANWHMRTVMTCEDPAVICESAKYAGRAVQRLAEALGAEGPKPPSKGASA